MKVPNITPKLPSREMLHYKYLNPDYSVHAVLTLDKKKQKNSLVIKNIQKKIHTVGNTTHLMINQLKQNRFVTNQGMNLQPNT